MKVKLAIFRNVQYDYLTAVFPRECNEDEEQYPSYVDDHIQITETIEVDFPEITKDEQIGKHIIIIDKQINKVMADSEAAINSLKGRKQELLAIGHDDE